MQTEKHKLNQFINLSMLAKKNYNFYEGEKIFILFMAELIFISLVNSLFN